MPGLMPHNSFLAYLIVHIHIFILMKSSVSRARFIEARYPWLLDSWLVSTFAADLLPTALLVDLVLNTLCGPLVLAKSIT